MCNSKSSAPREEIIIAQTASGDAKASQTQAFSRTEWLLIAIIGVLLIIGLIFLYKKWQKKLRTTIRREVHQSTLRMNNLGSSGNGRL